MTRESMKVGFAPAASTDLADIALYIARDNAARAATFIDELEATCGKLGDMPGIGTPRPELGSAVRMLPHASYLIFYREHPAEVRIERILHGTRDVCGDDVDP